MRRKLENLVAHIATLPHPAQDAAAEALQRVLFAPYRPQGLSAQQISELNRRYGDRGHTYAPLEQTSLTP